MNFPFPFFTGTGGGTKCARAFASPSSGVTPTAITISTVEPGGHIFYTIANDTGVDPTHTGDTATGTTIRIGSTSGGATVGNNGHDRILRTLTYLSGKADSDISEFGYSHP